jgi:6-phosphogluconolactonase/glucosamine-6-phosphate isomerase/deaminase
MDIIHVSDVVEANKLAAKQISTLVQKKTPTLLLLSGGSALNLLEHISPMMLGPHITIGVLDERFSTDPKVNNFSQLSALSFFMRAKQRGCIFIDTSVHQGEMLEDLTERFESTLREWVLHNPKGAVVVSQGVGPDGHTAGIMPFPEDPMLFHTLFDGPAWVVGYDAGKKNQYPLRITVTNTFLREVVDHSILYVIGDTKIKPLRDIISKKEQMASVPAEIVWDMKHVSLLTDQNVS